MKPILGKFSDYAYALMRFVVGMLFACHGAQKLFGAFGGIPMPLNPVLTAAGVIELVCGTLVAIGLAASYAAFLACGEMAAAYFMAHAPGGFWPIVNHGEPAVIYCFVFLYIAAKGAGSYSVEQMLGTSVVQTRNSI